MLLSIDALQMEFYGAAPAVGAHNLAAGMDNNYATCENCVRYLLDPDGNGVPVKQFYQQSGTLTIVAVGAAANKTQGSLSNVKLIEVDVDPNTFTSTPVPGGQCLTIASASWNTM